MPSLRLQTSQGSWSTSHEAFKPLPAVPGSPTLTNPDMVLPDSEPAIPSPPRWVRRPPSLSYLRDGQRAAPEPASHHGINGRNNMMLLRNRAPQATLLSARGSPNLGNTNQDTFIASSPILHDERSLVIDASDRLQPPTAKRRSLSGSSGSDLSGLNNFLAKYEKLGKGAEEAADDNDAAESVVGPTSYELKHDVDEQRRQQQEEEQTSAMLSQRAEQILANAKKRLNVMEGNLRGARDLLPLTAANLKRATTMNGSAHQYTSSYGYGLDFEPSMPHRTLNNKPSSPTMGREQGSHSRGLSAFELPDRPHTSFDHPAEAMAHNVRETSRTPEPSYSALRPARSYDSLGRHAYMTGNGTRERSYLTSPDSSFLEPLHEDDENRRSMRNPRTGNSYCAGSNSRAGISRPSSRASSIREQIGSLKGRISSLSQKAREDSLRRQSMADLRHSPFNNALTDAPEFYHSNDDAARAQSPAKLRPTSNASWFDDASPDLPSATDQHWNGIQQTGSRNAFAEQPSTSRDVHANNDDSPRTPNSKYQLRTGSAASFRPTSSMSQSSTATSTGIGSRFAVGAPPPKLRNSETFLDDEVGFLSMPSPELPHHHRHQRHRSSSDESSGGNVDDDNIASSEDDEAATLYEDANHEDHDSRPKVVAHEDRADAFDYENFLFQSAMARYTPGLAGPASDSDSEGSVTSVATARGPRVGDSDERQDTRGRQQVFDDDDEDQSFLFSCPQTPERLREIERGYHGRALSFESARTFDTFATAAEHGEGDDDGNDDVFGDEARPREFARSSMKTPDLTKRPGTAVKQSSSSSDGPAGARRSSSSDRADSGVGGLSQTGGGKTPASPDSRAADAAVSDGLATSTRPRTATMTSSSRSSAAGISTVATGAAGSLTSTTKTTTAASSPTSPRSSASATSSRSSSQRDPTTQAVNALLSTVDGPPLGLRSKAALFGVMESLRKLAVQLQQEEAEEADGAQGQSRVLRARLDEAKSVLDGVL